MAEITAALVKALREKTGAGMMDAKKALVENGGDEAAAVEWLRAMGLSKAAKKAGLRTIHIGKWHLGNFWPKDFKNGTLPVRNDLVFYILCTIYYI